MGELFVRTLLEVDAEVAALEKRPPKNCFRPAATSCPHAASLTLFMMGHSRGECHQEHTVERWVLREASGSRRASACRCSGIAAQQP